jgi:hypothetical protein
MLLTFSLVPLGGHLFESFFNRRTTIYILLVSILLWLPSLFKYEYILPELIIIPEFLFFSGIYSLYLRTVEKKRAKIILSAVLSCVGFIVLCFISFLNDMGGSKTVERKWEQRNYRIEYIRDQGYAGHARLTYELREYAVIPIFIKKTETVIDTCTNTCLVAFPQHGLNLNSCTGELKNAEKK